MISENRCLLLIFVLATGLVQAKEPLTGAFGIKLGEKLENSIQKSVKISESKSGETLHSIIVEPPVPNELFHSYVAVITGANHTTVALKASRTIDGKEACLSQLENLGRYLTKKYSNENGFEIIERGGWRNKSYLFAVQPPSSKNIVGGGCHETDSIDDGYFERGIFDFGDNVTYYFQIVYGTKGYFNGLSSSKPESEMDIEGL